MLPVSYTVWMAANLLLFTSTSWDSSAPRYVLHVPDVHLDRTVGTLPLLEHGDNRVVAAMAGVLTTQFVVGHSMIVMRAGSRRISLNSQACNCKRAGLSLLFTGRASWLNALQRSTVSCFFSPDRH